MKKVKTIKSLKEDSYSMLEASAILNLDISTTRLHLQKRNLSFKVGGRVFVRKSILHSYINDIINKSEALED